MSTEEQHQVILKELREIKANQAYLEGFVYAIANRVLEGNPSLWMSLEREAREDRQKVLASQ